MTVMVQTTTNYNVAGEIVSVIVFRVPVEDKMKPTDAQSPPPPDKNPVVTDGGEAGHGNEPPTRGAVAPTPTDAQIEAAAMRICSDRSYCGIEKKPCILCKFQAKQILTAAAEVGPRGLTPQEQQLMHGALRASSVPAAEVDAPNNYNTENYSYKAYEKAIEVAAIERCVDRLIELGAHYHQGHDLVQQLRALKDQ